ncbi:MAG: TCR/Tet family MFS transporter [Candidatus Eisenbacteria bacterium]|nr:TCR/Tet family MFS transporter [Candidatus Eisenbacteria bacterium]
MSRPGATRALVFVSSTVLLDSIGFGLIIPVLPTLLVQLSGRPVERVAVDGGWLSFAYATMQFVIAPVLGSLSDRFGRRPVLLAAVACFGADYLIMGFAPSIAWLFVGRLVSGAAGASYTPAYAYVADITPPERRAQSFGMISAAFGIGFILGPPLGGLIGGIGPRAPFFLAAILSLVNFVYGTFAIRESLPPERRRPFDLKRANPIGTLLQMRRHPAVSGVLAAMFLWTVGHQVMPSTWAFYTQYRFHWSPAMNGASLAAAGTIMALSQVFVLRLLVPRLGERRTALLGIGVAAIGYLGYASASAGWMMFAWLPTWLFGAVVMPSTNGMLSKRVTPDAQGELQGALACVFSLSAIAGPPLMTQIFSRFAAVDAPIRFPGAAFAASAVLAGTAALIYRRATRLMA